MGDVPHGESAGELLLNHLHALTRPLPRATVRPHALETHQLSTAAVWRDEDRNRYLEQSLPSAGYCGLPWKYS